MKRRTPVLDKLIRLCRKARLFYIDMNLSHGGVVFNASSIHGGRGSCIEVFVNCRGTIILLFAYSGVTHSYQYLKSVPIPNRSGYIERIDITITDFSRLLKAIV